MNQKIGVWLSLLIVISACTPQEDSSSSTNIPGATSTQVVLAPT